ncbi:hypothetical protein P5Z57_27075 [Pseudomonas sp. CD3(2023)]|uniref:hypothetical protein n=1 Tax=Pseudomonas sp. CD3(2023) TaxID=3036552 RepID=UPI0031BA037B
MGSNQATDEESNQPTAETIHPVVGGLSAFGQERKCAGIDQHESVLAVEARHYASDKGTEGQGVSNMFHQSILLYVENTAPENSINSPPCNH